MCMDHLAEILVAVSPILLGMWQSHKDLKKDVNYFNGDVSKQSEEVKKLVEAVNEILRKD